MDPLFSPAGMARLAAAAQPGMLCVFDFDGTLAPIVPRPDDARMEERVEHALADLAQRTPVALLTGRSVADLRGRCSVPVAYLVGNHGMEGLPGWEAAAAHYRASCRRWAADLSARLPDLGQSGVLLEDKGYSLSVHYRHAADPLGAARRLEEMFASLDPAPRVVAGKCVFNLVPAGAPDKGRAVEELVRLTGAPSVLFAGDDVTDEDVFRLRLPGLLSVRVEPNDESSAEFYLTRQSDILQLLRLLAERIAAAR